MQTTSAQDTEPISTGEPRLLSLAAIRNILGNSHAAAAREQAVRQLLPLLWSRVPWIHYHACCTLTTRIYMPYFSLMEWRSFPCVFHRWLRRGASRSLPATPEAQHQAVGETLRQMLLWVIAWKPQGRGFSSDVSADICEAVGRLGLYEAEEELLALLPLLGSGQYADAEVRMAALLALAALPPARLQRFWHKLSHGGHSEREKLASAIAYMSNPEAVPFLLQALPYQTGEFLNLVARPLLLQLGTIGDVRALPALQAIARDESHPLRPVARKAIQRLMKEAQGLEEVTLVRASEPTTHDPRVLLRPVQNGQEDPRPHQLLHPVNPLRSPEAAADNGNTADASTVFSIEASEHRPEAG
jgi:hypothetical protein